jgi:outer membrane protein TolC
MSEHDLSDKRVSSDDAMREVIQAKARVIALQKELAAVKRDRDDVYSEYRDLQAAKYPAKANAPKPVAAKGDLVRVIANDVHGSMMDRPAVDAFLADLKR